MAKDIYAGVYNEYGITKILAIADQPLDIIEYTKNDEYFYNIEYRIICIKDLRKENKNE